MPSFIDECERNGFLRGYYNQLQYEEEMKSLAQANAKANAQANAQAKAKAKANAKAKAPIIDKDGWELVGKKKR